MTDIYNTFNFKKHKNIAIYTVPRTGSSYICNLYKKSVLYKYEMKSPENTFRFLQKNNFQKIRSRYVFKVFPHRVQHIESLSHFTKNNYNVLLIRENIAQSIMSHLCASHTGIWHGCADFCKITKTKAKISAINALMNIYVDDYKKLLDEYLLFFNYDAVLSYEDLSFQSYQDSKLLKIKQPSLRIISQKSIPVEDVIINYEECLLYIKEALHNVKISDNCFIKNGFIQLR